MGHQEQPGFGKKCRGIGNQSLLGQDTCRHQHQAERDNYVTAEKVKNTVLGLEMRHETLLKVFAQHNEDFAKQVDAGLRSQSTYNKYCTV